MSECATGAKFGKWTVVDGTRTGRRRTWLCRCECGVEKEVRVDGLKRGQSTQCVSCSRRTHGMTASCEFRIWTGMRARCDYPTMTGYENYGGRGISYEKSWNSFEQFLADMGRMPKGHSLERRDVHKGYSKDNCYWLPRSRQQRNKRNTTMLTVNGVTRSAIEWSEITGVCLSLIHNRIYSGWTHEEAISPHKGPRARRNI